MTEMDAAQAAVYGLLLDEIAGSGLPDLAGELVLAAFRSAEALDEALSEALGEALAREPLARQQSAPPPPGQAPPARRPPGEGGRLPGVYLRSVSVQNFRGIGRQAVLHLRAGPGLTLVTGRNGSGKSSFAEAVELALTGGNERMRRGAIWREGWRNMHGGELPRIEVELAVEGSPGPVTVRRAWTSDTDLHAAETLVEGPGQPARPLAAMPWHDLLSTYRPFLSYAELGGLINDSSSQVSAALLSILGLDSLTSTDQRLMAARRRLDDRSRQVRRERVELVDALRQARHPRAELVATALADAAPSRWDLAAAQAAAAGSGAADGDAQLLDRLATLDIPPADEVRRRAAALRAAGARMRELADTPAEEARTLAAILDAAVRHYDQVTGHAAAGHGETAGQREAEQEAGREKDGPGAAACPVCGDGVLDAAWRAAAVDRVRRLNERAGAINAARAAAAQEVAAAHALVRPVPSVLAADSADTAGQPVDLGPARAAWRAWARLCEVTDPDALADGLEAGHRELVAATEQLVAAARARRDELDAAWRPLAARVLAWLPVARQVVAEQDALAALGRAREWLKDTAMRMRDERLRPFSERTGAIWAMLRQESNVELGPLRLGGTAARGRIILDVSVDGESSAALGVMSQGELHALGLALFLPRATVDESPFRFVVIDDPVQAMDPAKVDGLARVLLDVARERQVVVFTHDDRLADAVRRLTSRDPRAANTVIWDVVRRERSVVELRRAVDPVARYLADARALACSDRLPARIRATLAPTFCRYALDAVCIEVFRRRALAAGARHHEVEDALARAHGTGPLAALALFGDASRGGEVLPWINRRLGRRMGDVFRLAKGAGHSAFEGLDLQAFINDVARLAEGLRAA